MITILKKLKYEKKYVCIHTDESNLGKFVFGRIIEVDANSVAISMVSPDGEYDGLLIKQIDDIILIEQSISYENKMKKLMRIRGYDENNFEISNDNIMQWSLFFAKETRVIVSVELNHSGTDDVTGFVESVNEEICKIIIINEYGEEDGVSFFALKDISQISLDSSDENRLLSLFRNND